jgi:hypothetical protein
VVLKSKKNTKKARTVKSSEGINASEIVDDVTVNVDDTGVNANGIADDVTVNVDDTDSIKKVETDEPAKSDNKGSSPKKKFSVKAVLKNIKFTTETAQQLSESDSERITLSISKIHPRSVFKVSFLISCVIGLITIIAVSLFYWLLKSMDAFSAVSNFILGSSSSHGQFDITQFIGFGTVLLFAFVCAVLNIITITLLSTLGACIYNLFASLIGGIKVTLQKDKLLANNSDKAKGKN